MTKKPSYKKLDKRLQELEKKVSRDLHDSIGAKLTGIKCKQMIGEYEIQL